MSVICRTAKNNVAIHVTCPVVESHKTAKEGAHAYMHVSSKDFLAETCINIYTEGQKPSCRLEKVPDVGQSPDEACM